MKRALAMILVMVMVLSMVPAVYAEAAEPTVLLNLANEAVTASGYTFEYTAASAGTLNVTVGECSPGWRYKIYSPDGSESIYRTKFSAGTSCDYEGDAGNWKIVFYAYSSAEADNVAGTVSFTVSFTSKEGGDSGEVAKAEYEVSEMSLSLGDNTVTMLETAVTTIYTFKPAETGVYTFTAPAGAILGYWGGGSWLLTDPNSTSNTCEWTCTGVGQSAFIGVSGVDGNFNLNVAKTGDYTVVEIPIVLYKNKATLSPFTLPEGAKLHSYIDVTAATTHTAVLGEDGYYHLNSADGDVILVDMNYQDIILSAALNSDRPVMYAYTTDENGDDVKYDIGTAIKEYEAVMDENGYYPLTEDLILFYDTYAVGAGTYTFYVTGQYNEENVWMYCMRTVTMPEVTEPEETEPEDTEPEDTEPEETEPEETEPEETEPEETEPEASEPDVSEPVNGVIVFQDSVTGSSGTKYVYTYTPDEDGTLSITVGDGTASWSSDVVYFAGVNMTTVSSASGTNADTYEVTVTAGTAYRIRVWTTNGTATPLTIVFQSSAQTPTEPTEPETPQKEYEVSTTELTVGSNTLTLLDTAVTTVYKFKPTAVGTYTITAPEGAIVGNWGNYASYLKDPNSTSNTIEWTCTGVGQSVFVGVSNVEGEFVLLVEQETTPEPSEPETEPSEPETEPTTPSIPDEDVPAGTVYSVTVDGQTNYFNTTSASSINTQLKKITGTGYVKFYKDVNLGTSISNALTFDAGNVTVDLNGCTITFAYASVGALYVNGGTLTVIDTSAEGDGLVQNTHTSGYGIEIWAGTAYLKSGNVYGGSNGVRLYDAGDTFYMEGGNLTAQRYAVNAPAGSAAHISGGTLQATMVNQFAIYAAGTTDVTITGGYFNGTVSGSGLNGKISGGYFIKSVSTNYIASGCELQSNDDAVYLYKVFDPNAEPEEPDETEPTEPSEPETEPSEPSEPSEPETEPSEPETEPTVPSEPETEPSEPSQSGVLLDLANETVTVSGYVFEYTAATAGTLNVTVGTCNPGWRYKIYSPDGSESIYRTKWSAGESCDYEGDAGNWKIVFYAYSSAEAGNVDGTVSFTVSFTPKEGGDSGEVEKEEYEVSDTALVLGNNTLTLLETAVTTIYVFEPTQTGVYTFTAPAGAILGYWGGGSWLLTDPNSTTNTYEWTCTGVGQKAYIGVSGVTGSFNLNVEKTGDYTVVEIPIVQYENKAPLSSFTLPEGTVLGGYIDITAETVYTAVLGADGYYHLNSADGPIILVDMNYQDIILSNALKSDRPVMYAYVTDTEGNQIKYDIGAAIKEYEAVMDENGYYPLTEDLMLFYDNYAVGAGVYSFYVTGSYNEENVWMYCMRTATFPVNPVDRWNLVLDNDLNVNFYVNMGENDSVQVTVAGNAVTYKASELEMSEDGKYIVSVSIAAAQMMDEITVQIVGSDVVKSYTVRQYADTVLADSTKSQYHALIKEMLNYGAAAQIYFEHNSDNPANADITDAAAQDVPETVEEMIVDDQLSSLNFYGASLVYRDKIAVRFYFTGNVEGIDFGEYTVGEKDGMHYVEIADILPQDLDQQITVTVSDTEGNALTVTYGPMNYIVRMNAKGDENMQNLMKALYNYHLAAKALRAN